MALLVDPVVDTSETHFHFDRNMDGCMAAKEHDCTEDKDFETMEGTNVNTLEFIL